MLVLLHVISSLLAFAASQDGFASMQLQSRRPSDLTSLEPQPTSHTEPQQSKRNELKSGGEVQVGRNGEARISMAPKLLRDVAVRDVKGFRDGKVVAEVALFGTNAVRTVDYQPGDYAQLRNAQEMAERKGVWWSITSPRDPESTNKHQLNQTPLTFNTSNSEALGKIDGWRKKARDIIWVL